MSFSWRRIAYIHRKLAMLSRHKPNGSTAAPRTREMNNRERNAKAQDGRFGPANIPLHEGL